MSEKMTTRHPFRKRNTLLFCVLLYNTFLQYAILLHKYFENVRFETISAMWREVDLPKEIQKVPKNKDFCVRVKIVTFSL